MAHGDPLNLTGVTEIVVEPWRPEGDCVPARGEYVELFWLPILGPTAIMFLRRVASDLVTFPDGYVMDNTVMAACMGLHAHTMAYVSMVNRCARYGMVRTSDHGGLVIRDCLPRLSPRLIDRLHPVLQAEHARNGGTT